MNLLKTGAFLIWGPIIIGTIIAMITGAIFIIYCRSNPKNPWCVNPGKVLSDIPFKSLKIPFTSGEHNWKTRYNWNKYVLRTDPNIKDYKPPPKKDKKKVAESQASTDTSENTDTESIESETESTISDTESNISSASVNPEISTDTSSIASTDTSET